MAIFLIVLERTSLSCNTFWKNSHFNSPGEAMESTRVFYGKPWMGFSKHKKTIEGKTSLDWILRIRVRQGMSLIQRRNKQDHECLLACVARMLSKLCYWPGVLWHSGLQVSGEQSNTCIVRLQGNPSSLSTLKSWNWVRRGEGLRPRPHLSGWEIPSFSLCSPSVISVHLSLSLLSPFKW